MKTENLDSIKKQIEECIACVNDCEEMDWDNDFLLCDETICAKRNRYLGKIIKDIFDIILPKMGKKPKKDKIILDKKSNSSELNKDKYEHITERDAAAYLGITSNKLSILRKKSKAPAHFMKGRLPKYLQKDLDIFANTKMPGENLLNGKDAAEYLKISPSTLSRWKRENTGPTHTTFGTNIMYTKSDLDYFIRKNTFKG